jgi:hypothetical protein
VVVRVTSPGPVAERAFRTGVRAAAVLGLAAVGSLYWTGALAGDAAGFVVVLLFPAYMLVVASALAKWLGYDKGPRNLRRVTRDENADSESGSDRW